MQNKGIAAGGRRGHQYVHFEVRGRPGRSSVLQRPALLLLAGEEVRRPAPLLRAPADLLLAGEDLRRPALLLLSGKDIRRPALVLRAPADLLLASEDIR